MIKRLPKVIPVLIVLFGLALSSYATVPVVRSWYNLTGFGNATTGGGMIATNDPAYVQVTTPLGFANALQSAYKTNGSVKVIEIMNDLSLGWNEVGATVQAVGPFRAPSNGPLLHPVLLTVGESLIDIKPKGPLTIFSANGATIKHCNFNIKSCANIIIRNLKFDENWEWDENTKGQYDRNDWDFITVGNGGAVSNLWVDHCTFTKSYDGILDTKDSCSAITISWCKYIGDDGATNPNSWVRQQINVLEASRSSYAFYNFLRSNGFSVENIVQIIQAHDKTHLAGQNDLDPNNATITMTFHHQLVNGLWDRCMPRLRAGNAHDYNIYVDDTSVLAAKRLRDAVAAAMSPASWTNLNNTYSFDPPVNGSISTESGAVLVAKSVYIDCLWPLRNNQTDTNNPAYTGRIMALDSVYHMDNTNNPPSTDFRGDSTNSIGFSLFGPAQATTNNQAFSWNQPGGQLPYTYTMHDPSQLKDILTSPTAGAGAGVLTWNKTNWLATSYPDTAPIIDTDPQSQTVTNGQSVTLNVTAYGSLPLWYKWYFNTNSPVTGGTNMSLTIPSVQPSDLGDYSVVVSNSVGTATSAFATLGFSSAPTPFQNWQTQYFNCTNCPQADAAADPDGDGQNNMAEFLSGTDPTNSGSALRILSAVPQGTDVVIAWTTAGGHTNAVQAASGDANGGYSNNFVDITAPPHIIVPGSGDATNNYVDVGGATNSPSRFYRIRLVP